MTEITIENENTKQLYFKNLRKLNKQFLGLQNIFLSSNPDIYSFKKNFLKNHDHTVLINEINFKLTGTEKCFSIEIDEPSEVYFNLLELKIFNPDYTDFDDIFEQICFGIGKQRLTSLYNKSTIEIYNKIFKSGKGLRQIGQYMYIPLPFINSEALINSPQNIPKDGAMDLRSWDKSVNIKFRIKNNNRLNTLVLSEKMSLYGTKYILDDPLSVIDTNIMKEMIYHQIQFTGKESYGYYDSKDRSENEKISKDCEEDFLHLNFNHLIHAFYIETNVSNDLISHFTLEVDGMVVLKYTPAELHQINTNLGYPDLKFPTFIFGNNTDSYSNTIPNFSRIEKACLRISFKIPLDVHRTYEIFAINYNVLRTVSHHYGLGYSN